MKKSLRVLALLLSVLLLWGCQNNPGTTPNTTAAPTGPADYQVTIVDPMGVPYAGVGVKFLQNGEQIAMGITNDAGTVTKELERGNYTLLLSFQDVEHTFYYDAASAELTATKTTTQIVAGYEMGTQSEQLMVANTGKVVYTLQFADTSVTVTGAKDTSADGTYTFTRSDDGSIQVDGEKVQIAQDLLKEYSFSCEALAGAQKIVDAEHKNVTAIADGTYYVLSHDYEAYHVDAGCTYVKLNESGRNYFIFTPKQAGIYEFTVMGEGTVGAYGTPNFVYGESNTEVVDNKFQITVAQDMIGTNGTGTTQLVVGVDTQNAGTNTYLCITRVGDAPKVVEWEMYVPTYTPSKYTLPAGATLVNFDLSKEYTLVYNDNDHFYHLNTADGPVVLVRLLSANDYSGFAFGNILLGSNIGTYHYDENDTLVSKVMYNDCVQAYLGNITGEGEDRKFSGGMCDETEGVYPLTKDLETVLKNYGEYMGYWDSNNPGYLFADVENLNTEIAWLFACCYVA